MFTWIMLMCHYLCICAWPIGVFPCDILWNKLFVVTAFVQPLFPDPKCLIPMSQTFVIHCFFSKNLGLQGYFVIHIHRLLFVVSAFVQMCKPYKPCLYFCCQQKFLSQALLGCLPLHEYYYKLGKPCLYFCCQQWFLPQALSGCIHLHEYSSVNEVIYGLWFAEEVQRTDVRVLRGHGVWI